jgi:ferredoxin
MSMDARKADALLFPAAESSFDITEALREAVEGPLAAQKTVGEPEAFTRFIKGWARHLGALDVGIAVLQPEHIYSHIGRGTGVYGAPIDLQHRYAIAFTVEMSSQIMSQAPEAPVVMESARKYVDAAVIAISLANLCRRLGYPARGHIDGNYRLIAPLIARQAGLGEIGRMGILMTPRQGPRVRLGVVSSDLPLVADEPGKDDSMIDFCRICTKCAHNCPSQAIPFGDRQQIDGALRWKLDEIRCFQYWNVIGTDCGLCMAVCPYAHPDDALHNIVRGAIKRSGFSRRAALWLDDLFYGRKPTMREPPEWLYSAREQ